MLILLALLSPLIAAALYAALRREGPEKIPIENLLTGAAVGWGIGFAALLRYWSRNFTLYNLAGETAVSVSALGVAVFLGTWVAGTVHKRNRAAGALGKVAPEVALMTGIRALFRIYLRVSGLFFLLFILAAIFASAVRRSYGGNTLLNGISYCASPVVMILLSLMLAIPVSYILFRFGKGKRGTSGTPTPH